MSFKPFRRVRFGSDDGTNLADNVNTLQDNVAAAFQQLLNKDALDTTLVKNISLTAGVVNKVPHMLGRALNGYMVTRCHGGYPLIYDVQDTNPSPHLLIYLMSATNITVDLLVF